MAFLVTTTGTLSPVVINDLAGRTFVHPLVAFDLETLQTPGEIAASVDLQSAINAGHITVTNGNGDPITQVGQASLPNASETTRGIAELATQGETDTGTDDGRIVTPLKLATNPRLPTQAENDALVGTSGAPGSGNKYVTDADPRNTNARTPTAHATSHQHGGADEVGTASPGANAIPKANGAGKFADGWIAQSSVTQHQSAIDHNSLLNYTIAEHRQINDAGTSTIELWSSSKINNEIAAATRNLDLKDSVKTVATGNVTLSGEQTLNGVLTSNSRVAVVGQTNAQDNGIYVTAAGAWTRATDADSSAEVTQGLSFFVSEGTKQGFQYILTTPDPITLGTTPLSFVEVKRVEFGTTSGTATEGNDPRVPTQPENDALQGTDGAPSNSNRYVTNSDPRNTDARTPTAHATSHQPNGSDPLPTAIASALTSGGNAAVGTSNSFARADHVHAMPPFPVFQGDVLISGGASWDSGLTYNVSALVYVINGTQYTSPGGQVTLAAADPSFDRIDVIVANTSGGIGVVTGTPSANPVKPDIDTSTQIEVTFATVGAGATTPTGVAVSNVYLENAGTGGGEWNTVTNAPARINLASTSNPYQGTTDIEATNALNGDYFYFDFTTGFETANQTNLEFALRAKTQWSANGHRFQIQLYSPTGYPLGNLVDVKHGNFGFDRTNTSTYQIISIPRSLFNTPTTQVRYIIVWVRNTMGFYMDRVRWQTGLNYPAPSSTDPNAIHRNVANEISTIALKASPVSGDLLVIEDSAASNAKKRITIGSLPAGTPAAHASSHLPNGSDPLTTAAPGATSVATAAAAGTANSFARSDHVHQSNTAPVNVTKAAAAIGTSGEPARADHKHDVTTAAAVANPPGTASAEGVATSLARSDHTHAMHAYGSSANTICQGNDSRLLGTNNVTNSNLAQMAANTAKVNATAGTADPQDLAVGTNTVLGRQAGNIVAAQVATGQIANSAVTNALLANMAANTVKANATAGSAAPADLAVGTNTVVGRVAGNIVAAQLATGQIANNAVDNTKAAQMAANTVKANATAGTANQADLAVGTNTVVGRVAGNIVAAQLVAAQVTNNTLDNTKLAQMAQSTVKGRAAGAGTGDPQDLTSAQATALLDVFTSSLKGLAPASGGGTANFLRADATWAAPTGQQLYDAVVAPSGGDFTLPSAAFAAGRTRVFIRGGVYVENADVVIPNGGCLHGASGATLVMSTFQVRVDGQARKTTAGTISFTNGSATVTGSGTAFTGLQAGDFIALGPDYYEIASIGSSTSLTLVKTYRGRSQSGQAYVAQGAFRGVSIRDVSIVNSTHANGGLFLRGVLDSIFLRLGVDGCTLNFNLVDCGNLGLLDFASANSGGDGVQFTGCRSIGVANAHLNNNVGNGANITGSGGGIAMHFVNCEFTMNGAAGATVQGTATDVTFVGCGSKYNLGKGFNTEPTTVRTVISGCTIQFNGGVGVDVDGSQNVLSNCQIGNNGAAGVLGGVRSQVANCYVHDNAGVGIDLNGDSDTVITGNTVSNNTTTGISLTSSNDVVIDGNRVLSNGTNGILIPASGSARARLVGNTVTGHTRDINDASDTSVYPSERTGRFTADQLDSPVTADWAVNALAPAVADSANSGLTVRRFDDTVEEGVSFSMAVPAFASQMRIRFRSKAQTAPPAARTVGVKLYHRNAPDNGAVTAWSSNVLTDIDIPTNLNYQYDYQVIALSSMAGVIAGRCCQFELTRIAPTGGTNLAGDWCLLDLQVEFM